MRTDEPKKSLSLLVVFADEDRGAATKVLERLRPVLTYSSISLHVEDGSGRGWRSYRDHQGVLYFASSDLFSDDTLCDELAVARAQDLKMFGVQLRPYVVPQPWANDMLGARVALSTSPSVIDTVVADFRMAMRMWQLEAVGSTFDVPDSVLLPAPVSAQEAEDLTPAQETVLAAAVQTVNAKLRGYRRGESVVCDKGEGWTSKVVDRLKSHFAREWVIEECSDFRESWLRITKK